eukprot:5586363-Heterocapsa_arctica.AAC.1
MFWVFGTCRDPPYRKGCDTERACQGEQVPDGARGGVIVIEYPYLLITSAAWLVQVNRNMTYKS